MGKHRLAVAAALILVAGAPAHDTWVQTNSSVVRVGDNIHIDLMLGNHGNDHRDFKLASKFDPADGTLEVIAPDGKRYDIKDRLVDTGYTPKEGFWTARFAAAQPGLYTVAHTSDKVASYAPVRVVRSAKTYFVVSQSLDKVPVINPGFEKPLGHALELVPERNPVTPMGPETPIVLQLLFKGKPLPNAKVSFIPRGETLKEGFDQRYERLTDANGGASYTPKEGNYYLVVAHWEEPNEGGKDYQSTKYTATLAILVPQICPCCGE
jgi:uncharacterized GH25 family protein